jgi:hypothetical protein
MTAQVKRKLSVVPIGSPEHDRRMERGDYIRRLEAAARKADLLAWALQGVMAIEDSDAAWPLQDCAYELKSELEALAGELPE